MKITILYDNTAWEQHLTPDWGFACLVEAHGKKILFDTGAKGRILADNMHKLGVDPFEVDAIFISHDHWDHTGGLPGLLKQNQAPLYVPESFKGAATEQRITRIRDAEKIYENIYTTGELKQIEQALAVRIGDEVAVVAGCSHPGVREIIRAATNYGHVTALIGGLHDFNDFDIISDLKMICPTHCTRHIKEIAVRYPEKYIPGGAGRIIEVQPLEEQRRSTS